MDRYSFMKKFIRTKSKPYIFYMPKVIDKSNQDIFEENEKSLQDELDKKKSELECELKSLETQAKNFNTGSSLLQNSQYYRDQTDQTKDLELEMEIANENNKNLEDVIR